MTPDKWRFMFFFFVEATLPMMCVESPISDIFLKFALLSLWNLLFYYFQIWCSLSSTKNSRGKSKHVLYLGDFSATF